VRRDPRLVEVRFRRGRARLACNIAARAQMFP
jgi:hypothetical protein